MATAAATPLRDISSGSSSSGVTKNSKFLTETEEGGERRRALAPSGRHLVNTGGHPWETQALWRDNTSSGQGGQINTGGGHWHLLSLFSEKYMYFNNFLITEMPPFMGCESLTTITRNMVTVNHATAQRGPPAWRLQCCCSGLVLSVGISYIVGNMLDVHVHTHHFQLTWGWSKKSKL